MTEATPRPWRISHEDGTLCIMGPSGVVSVWAFDPVSITESADAALIVEAVNAYDDLKAESARLRAALDEAVGLLSAITKACEIDCCSDSTETEPFRCSDDESVMRGADGGSALTFGHIRSARAFIDKQKP